MTATEVKVYRRAWMEGYRCGSEDRDAHRYLGGSGWDAVTKAAAEELVEEDTRRAATRHSRTRRQHNARVAKAEIHRVRYEDAVHDAKALKAQRQVGRQERGTSRG